MYRRFGGKREFKKYLYDEGARLLFKFRSGTHGLNEELGRHSDRDGRVECTLCAAECESVVHVLWECSTYSTCRDNFQEALKQFLGARYAEFEALSAVEKASYVLGSESWEDDFDALLHLVKEFIVAVWEVRKQKLYGDDSYPGQLQASPRPEIGVLLLELGVGLVSRVSLVSHMVRVRAMLCMLV